MTADNILRYLQSNTAMLKKHKVSKIGLFGSYSKGQQTHESDIDFLVEYLPGEKSFDNLMLLIDSLENDLEKNVEVVTPESISQSFHDRIRPELKYVQVNY